MADAEELTQHGAVEYLVVAMREVERRNLNNDDWWILVRGQSIIVGDDYH